MFLLLNRTVDIIVPTLALQEIQILTFVMTETRTRPNRHIFHSHMLTIRVGFEF